MLVNDLGRLGCLGTGYVMNENNKRAGVESTATPGLAGSYHQLMTVQVSSIKPIIYANVQTLAGCDVQFDPEDLAFCL